MGTLVQAPERADSTVTGLQPIARPQERSVGSFLGSILEPVAQAAIKYQDDNAGKNIALGMNDKLNGVVREVSFLDQKNYKHGINYQGVVNGQAGLTKKFQEDLDNVDPNNPDPDELFRISKEYQAATVDNIYNSDLPADLKETLYKSTLQENATYMTSVQKKLKQVAADTQTTALTNMTAVLARDLGSTAMSTDERMVSIGAFRDKVVAGIRAVDPNVSLEDAQQVALDKIKAAFTVNLKTISATGSPEDAAKAQQLAELAEGMMDFDLSTSTELLTAANTVIADMHSNADASTQFELSELINRMKYPNTDVTREEVLNRIVAIKNDPTLTFEDKQKYMTQLNNEWSALDIRRLEAETIDDPLQYDNPSDYERIGKSEGDWVKDHKEAYLKAFENPFDAGRALMMKGANSAEYSGQAVKEGSELVFRPLIGYLSMSDADVAKDEFSKVRQQQFSQIQQLYQQYKQENGSKAADMLSGIDSKYLDVFATALENGGSLEDARAAFSSPIDMTARYKYLDTAIENLTAKDLGLNTWFGGTGGTGARGRAIPDALEDTYTMYTQTALNESKAFLVPQVGSANTSALVSRAKTSGVLLPSPYGYSATIMPARVAKQVQNFKVTGTTASLDPKYMGKAIDAERQKYAKTYNVAPANVIAVADSSGNNIQFYAYELTGKTLGIFGDGTPTLKNGNAEGIMSGGSTTLARLKKDAETFRQADIQRKEGIGNSALDDRYMSTRVGSTVLTEYRTGRKLPAKVSAHWGKGMGNNLGLGTLLVNHFAQMEGFVTKRTKTVDANTGRVSHVYGLGMTEATLNSMGLLREAQAAQGNAQAMLDLNGKFMQRYYSTMNKDLQRVGIPAPTANAYPPALTPSLMLMYDVKWHAGNTDALVKAMNAPTYKEGRRRLQALSTYNKKNLGSKRNRFMETALLSHFKAKGKS